ncbi:MAG: heavy metal translocating P-type ATPase [Pseudomonadota bacterium]
MSATCEHCGQSAATATAVEITTDSGPKVFCCHGCEAAWQWINSSGLGRFYDHRQPGNAVNAVTRGDDYALAAVAAHYVAHIDGQAEVTLDIGGMHCAACAWLIEAVAARCDGIVRCDVSLSSHRAVVRFDPQRTNLGEIVAALAKPGFAPQPVIAGETSERQVDERRRSLKRLAVAALFGMQTMMLAIGLYLGEFHGMSPSTTELLELASLALTLPILLYAARPFYAGAWRGLAERRPGMDVPVALALTIAFGASLLATMGVTTTVYYDSVAMFVLFLSASRYLEQSARHRAEDSAVSLARLLPDAVDRITDTNGTERIARSELSPRDRVVVRAGDTVPADGVLAAGSLTVDEAILSGEARPIAREVGDRLTAGAGIVGGTGQLLVERTGASTELAGIGRLIERARSGVHRHGVADKLATNFVVGVLATAALAAAVWSLVDPGRVIPITLAVLIVACPCALALATPTALASAATVLSQAGVLLVNSRLIHTLGRRALILFDKTGTLTLGRPSLAATHRPGPADDGDVRQLAAALEAHSEHPLSGAFAACRTDAVLAESVDIVAGAGVEGTIAGIRYRVGNATYVSELVGTELPFAAPLDKTRVYLGHVGVWDAAFDITDELRPDAAATVQQLQAAGFAIAIASGDHSGVVSQVAAELGIDGWHAELSPSDKLELLAQLRRDDRAVIMVGDGVNDAPVLAAADAAIAMGGGTALAQSNADAVLVDERLQPLVELVALAATTRTLITQSAAWAIGYNLTAVAAASLGWVTPWMAAIGMSASSLLVVGNALRLQRVGHRSTSRKQPLTERPA